MKSQRAFGEALRRHRERSGVDDRQHRAPDENQRRAAEVSRKGRLLSLADRNLQPVVDVREYAVAVGLDPDDLASQFSECFAQTAFPERPAAPKKANADFPRAEPMRLTFASDASARLRMARRRSALVALDVLLIVVLAAALRMTVVADFWMALAGVTIACHSLAVAAGGRGAADLFAGIFRPPPEPVAEEAPQESAVAEGI